VPTECIILPLRLSLIGSTYSMVTMKDTVNPRWSTVAPFSPGETTSHHPCLLQITAFPASEGFWICFNASFWLGSWRAREGRIVIPPGVPLLSPSIAALRFIDSNVGTTLAVYLSTSSGNGFCTRTNSHR